MGEIHPAAAMRRRLSASAAVLAICAAQPAIAQQQADANAAGEESVIIVTGTLFEGIDPVGTNVIGINAEQIQESGVTNATDLLRRLPQAGDFNAVPQPTTDGSIPFSPISLRNIGALSGMASLILLDGKRIVPTSPGHNWIDTQMIPAGIIERVEVILDGGSSIYGSDAVGGVVNFVTRRRMDGVAVDASYGLGKGDYSFWDATASAGTDWNSGSAVLSYSYSDREALFGRDLGYLIEDKTSIGGADSRSASCAPGTVSANDTSYALPGLAPGTANFCSALDSASFYPEEQRHSVFGTLTQNISAAARLEVNAFWSRREANVFDPDNARSSGTITSTNPYFDQIAAESEQSVAFSYESVLGTARANPSVYEAWQISPTLFVDVADGWSLQLGLNYGESDSFFDTNRINGEAQSAALAATTTATALNPYNPATSNAAVLAAISDFLETEASHQEILEGRLVIDGELVALPGGDLRIAVGGEARREEFNRFRASGPAANQGVITDIHSDREVLSLFGEFYAPLFEGFEASVSGRFDDYSDVGSTFNPKLGFTYEPAEWVKLRGSWGTAFHAPALADLSAPLGYELFLPISPFRASDSPFFPDFFKPSFLLTGAAPGIKPETAETWSVGVDFEPAPGLVASVSYWNIAYEDRVDQNAGFFFGPGYYSDPANAAYFILNPADPQAIINQFGNFPVFGFPDLGTMFAIFGSPYVVSDQRKQNLGSLNLDGIDFNLAYRTDVAGGELDAAVNGTYLLNRDRETVPGSGFFETLDTGDFNSPISAFNATASLGWGTGPLYASATVYHRGGAQVGVEDIASHSTVSLYGRYELAEFVTLSVNVDNLFDKAPPVRSTVTNGRAFIDAGRVVKFGIGARF